MASREDMKIVALLPMKGNSERVPNKNMRNFDGAPLYHAVMNTLLASKYISQVVVDTDCDVIEDDVKRNFSGCEVAVKVVRRPERIQGDYVSMNDIISYDISQVEADTYIQTHSTNPLLRKETLDSAIESYLKRTDGVDSLFSVTKLQTRLYDKSAMPVNHNPNELLRTQDLEPLFEENSNFFIFSKDSFSEAGNKRIGLKPMIFEVNKLEAVDIDEPDDFVLAELLHIHKDR